MATISSTVMWLESMKTASPTRMSGEVLREESMASALGDDVGFALLLAAEGADLGAGVDVEFIRRLREDDGTDVAAFHDDGSVQREFLLLGDEEGADFGHLRDERDAFVDVGLARVRERVDAGEAEGEFAVSDGGFDGDRGDGVGDGGGVLKRDVALLEVPSDAAVHGAGVDVDVAEGARRGCGKRCSCRRRRCRRRR